MCKKNELLRRSAAKYPYGQVLSADVSSPQSGEISMFRNKNSIVLVGLLIFFAAAFYFLGVQKSFTAEAQNENFPGRIMGTPPPGGEVPLGPEENNAGSQEQAALPGEKSLLAGGAENLEKRIQDIEARGKNLETWNSIVAVLFIISLLFNVYFGLKVRYILRKSGTSQ